MKTTYSTISFITSVFVLLASFALFANPVSAAGTPFECDGTLYLSQSADTKTPTTLYTINHEADPFSLEPRGNSDHGIVYNALGYNPEDNYLYGIAQYSNNLVRIYADGSAEVIGSVAGLPAFRFYNGTFSEDGDYIVMKANNGTPAQSFSTVVYTVDVTSRTLTSSVILDRSDLRFGDIMHNPVDGMVYGVSIAKNDTEGKLFAIDGATGVTTEKFDTGLKGSEGNPIGATYSSKSGELYANVNSGSFYSFDLDTEVSEFIAASQSASVNDGANCIDANILKEEEPEKEAPDDTSKIIAPSSNQPSRRVVRNISRGSVRGSSTPPACRQFTQRLKKGDRDGVGGVNEVAQLQRFLATYLKINLQADGVFGISTEAAVHQFQKSSPEAYNNIIKPWTEPAPGGVALPDTTTGNFYTTSKMFANHIIGCPEGEAYLEDPKKTFSITTKELLGSFSFGFNQ